MIRIKNRRYIGNKNRLLNLIIQSIENNVNTKNYSFADLFAGTGIVSYHLAERGHKTFVNDILYSNFIAYKAWFSTEKVNIEKVQRELTICNDIKGSQLEENYFSKIYGGKYYSISDAKKIGYIRDYIENQKINLNEREYAILITSLIYAADKAANTVGHFEHFLKLEPKENRLKLEMIELPTTHIDAELYNCDANVLATQIKADVVYLDPPYNARQYVNFYHVLENLARWEKPTDFEGISMKFKRNNLKSGYSKSQAPLLFQDLIAVLDCELIVVSYNNTYSASSTASNNKITEHQLVAILSQKGELTCREIDYTFFNAGKTNFKNHKEKLYICKMR